MDIVAVEAMITTHRDRIIEMFAGRKQRPRDEVAHDLDQFLALSRLFDAAYLTYRIESDRPLSSMPSDCSPARRRHDWARSPKP